jgi:hypothetical protein
MAFKKAKPQQAFLKMGIYGPPGSGKTFTALLFAEGLAKINGKRIAYIDTEHGTDFYAQDVIGRKYHTKAFDFDAIYTRSITEIAAEVKGLSSAEHDIVIIDSITHLWEAARAAYAGKFTRAGTIPIQAWGQIKKPYKDLLNYLLNAPLHVFILGRQGIDFETDEETGEMKKVGYKMKAEGETPYEPHILLRMNPLKDQVASLFVEKDRTGVLAGKVIVLPDFDNTIAPLLSLLGKDQAQIQGEDETASRDAESLTESDIVKQDASEKIFKSILGQYMQCTTKQQLYDTDKKVATPANKRLMTTSDVSKLKEEFKKAETILP